MERLLFIRLETKPRCDVWTDRRTELLKHIWAATLLAPHAKSTSVLILGNFMEVLTIFDPCWEKTEMKSLVFTLSSLTVYLH